MVYEMRRIGLCRIAIAVVALALVVSPLSAAVIYVKGNAAGTNAGTSWTNAYVLLQSALDAAVSGDEIWVAAGTYKPTSDYGLVASGTLVQDRLKHFRLKNGVAIYGGFAGTESKRSRRDVQANVTTLSGNIGAAGDAGDNCYHVFHHPNGLGLDVTAVLDGFTVTAGNANGTLTVYYVRGGGMLNDHSSPTIANCTFSGNSASNSGGGMENFSSSPTIMNCAFSDNSASYYGGGMENVSGSPTITGCTFTGNSAADYGGGMKNYEASPTMTDCVFRQLSRRLRRRDGKLFFARDAHELHVQRQLGGLWRRDMQQCIIPNAHELRVQRQLDGLLRRRDVQQL